MKSKPLPRNVSVIMTCVGSPMAVEMVMALSRMKNMKGRVIGVDSKKDAVGKHYADAFYQVPPGNDPGYLDAVLAICKKEGVNVVIPGSDEEAIAMACGGDRFKQAGVVSVAPREELADPLSDKGAMYDWLGAKGVPLPSYRRVRSVRELEEAASLFGYPDKPFIIKPSAARGGRGIWKIDGHRTSLVQMLTSLSLEGVTLETLLAGIEKEKSFPSLLAMEYIDGDVFDIDLLARGSQIYYLIPRRRFHPRTVPFRGCYFDRHEGVLELAHKVQDALSLTYLFDFDIMLDRQNVPHLLEVNPRLSGSSIASIAAGINLLEYVVRLALGLDVPIVEIPYGKAIRPSYRTVCGDL